MPWKANPGLINKSPYENGWILPWTFPTRGKLNALMTEEQYQDFLKSGAAAHH